MATPCDNPAEKIDAPDSQHINDIYKVCYMLCCLPALLVLPNCLLVLLFQVVFSKLLASNSGVELVKLYLYYQKENVSLKEAQAGGDKRITDVEQELKKKEIELESIKARNLELEGIATKLEETDELTSQLRQIDVKVKTA